MYIVFRHGCSVKNVEHNGCYYLLVYKLVLGPPFMLRWIRFTHEPFLPFGLELVLCCYFNHADRVFPFTTIVCLFLPTAPVVSGSWDSLGILVDIIRPRPRLCFVSGKSATLNFFLWYRVQYKGRVLFVFKNLWYK